MTRFVRNIDTVELRSQGYYTAARPLDSADLSVEFGAGAGGLNVISTGTERLDLACTE